MILFFCLNLATLVVFGAISYLNYLQTRILIDRLCAKENIVTPLEMAKLFKEASDDVDNDIIPFESVPSDELREAFEREL